MQNIGILILLSTLGSVVSLSAGALLLSNKRLAHSVARYSGPFAAGALVAAVFIDLLPESLGETDMPPGRILLFVVAGILAFFLLERRLRWFHHHHDHQESKAQLRTIRPMLVIGDTIHNAIDGIAIAFAYLADPTVGYLTTFAVAMHELPQEIGDFGLMLRAGWSRKKVLYINLFSALATVVAAVITYIFGRHFENAVAPALAVTSGTLLYIALSDIIPSVHEEEVPKRRWFDVASLLFIAGVAVVTIAVTLAGQLEA